MKNRIATVLLAFGLLFGMSAASASEADAAGKYCKTYVGSNGESYTFCWPSEDEPDRWPTGR